ncbi:hypothetical protein TSH7_13940 [Azospirillum sp. TSH7]|nr:hypothetical protein TSH7_13940 [Azospirillum sp. TSH7]
MNIVQGQQTNSHFVWTGRRHHHRSGAKLDVHGISTPFLKAFLDRYAQHATMMEFTTTRHWIREERPAETTATILEFLGQP